MNDETLIEDLSWLRPPVNGEGSLVLWIWLGAGLLAALGIAWFLWNRRRKGKSVLPFLEPPKPHERAMDALKHLEPLMLPGREKEFALEVSRVVRIYIQDRFGLRAPHRSTEEFLYEAAQSRQLEPAHQELLAGFLMRCDLVKFARQLVAIPDMQELLKAARRFVAGTIPPEQRAPAKPKVLAR